MQTINPATSFALVIGGFSLIAGLVVLLFRDALMSRKIQPGTFKWSKVRQELRHGVINLVIVTLTITLLLTWWKNIGWIECDPGPASWTTILWEYALSFFLFDAYFYWVHRFMHKEPYYSWVHKLHHRYTAPISITSWSMNPIEGVIEGMFTPLFMVVFTIHEATVPFIVPTSILMGLYVHSGFELLPPWWNKSWLTKWFISATFHDEHHHYFTGNFGGYTTIWDRLCGTMRPKYEANYDKAMARAAGQRDKVPVSLKQ
ncbi:MAG: sterol desaturase family protein [Sphingobium sp.]